MTTPTPSDFRALCAELLKGLDENRHPEVRYPGHLRIVMAEARAALEAQPEPVGPTDEQINQCYAALYGLNTDKLGLMPVRFGRELLARWGRSAIEPIPVSELPGPGDLNKDEEVWIWEPAFDYPLGDTGDYDIEPGKWVLRRIIPFDIRNNRRWLPHWAFPTPRSEENLNAT